MVDENLDDNARENDSEASHDVEQMSAESPAADDVSRDVESAESMRDADIAAPFVAEQPVETMAEEPGSVPVDPGEPVPGHEAAEDAAPSKRTPAWKFWARREREAAGEVSPEPSESVALPGSDAPEAAASQGELATPSVSQTEVEPSGGVEPRAGVEVPAEVEPAAVVEPPLSAEPPTAVEPQPAPAVMLGEPIPTRPWWKFWVRKGSDAIPSALEVPPAAAVPSAAAGPAAVGASAVNEGPMLPAGAQAVPVPGQGLTEALPGPDTALPGAQPVSPSPTDAWGTPAETPVRTDQFGWPITGSPVESSVDETAILPPVEAPYPEQAAVTTVLPLPADILQPVPDANRVGSVSGAAATAALAPPVPIDMGPERRANYWVWIGVAVGVILMAGIIAFSWWYTTSRAIAVPNVVGKLSAQATQTLNDADLRLGKVSEVPTDTAPPGTVIQQTPSAYSSLKPGQTVALVVAGEPDMIKVPDVSGRDANEAVAALASARLAARPIETYNTTVAAGFVISQLPSATAQLEPGSLVVLAVSKGPAPATQRVPQITGLNQADAAALLTPLGFRYVAVRSFNNSIPVGVVMSQTPLPESQNPPDTVVLYSVSAGPGITSVSVPNVTSQARAEAERRITQVALRSQVIEVAHATVPKGNVISQMPAAGAPIENGGTVALLVSKGAATSTPVPSIVTQSAEEASKTAASAGYTPTFVEVSSADQTVGTVFMQWPLPGTPAPIQTPLIALVAKAPK